MTELASRRPACAHLLDRAVHILAACDHSEQELRRKFTAPIVSKNGPEEVGATAEDYERTIAWCHGHGCLDDDRSVARFVASCSRKGYGPVRVRRELNQKGISREAIEKAMHEYDIDWCVLVRNQATRKYGEPLPTIFSERVKIQYFLFYRGYLMEDIQDTW